MAEIQEVRKSQQLAYALTLMGILVFLFVFRALPPMLKAGWFD